MWYSRINNNHKWTEYQKMAKPKSNIYSVLVTKKAIIHYEFGQLDFLERWIYDDESDSFFVEDFSNLDMRSGAMISTDKTMTYSRPLVTVIQDNQTSWNSWSDWLKSSSREGKLFSRTRCREETLDCQTQFKNMTDSKSLLIIGSGSSYDFFIVCYDSYLMTCCRINRLKIQEKTIV